MPRCPRGWTPGEDRILLEKAKQQVSGINKTDTTISWTSVSNALPGRNNKDCRKRWLRLIDVKKGAWTLSQNARLLEGVQKYGRQWAMVAKTVETRKSDQCAKRWQHSLDPSLDRSEWTNEKDAQFIAAVRRYGTSWKDIKKFEFPMRSTTNLQNRYATLVRQSNKTPSVYRDEASALKPSIDWLSIEQKLSDNMMIEMSKDGDSLKDGYNESSRTSISTFPFGNDLTIERSPRHYHPDSESPSHPDLVQPAAPYYPPFDNLLGLTFNRTADVDSALPVDVNDSKPYKPELPIHTTSSDPSQRANLNDSPSFDGVRSGEASHQGSNQQPWNAAGNVSSRVPQMTLTIDNPDTRTMSSVLEVLSKIQNKVTISMNT